MEKKFLTRLIYDGSVYYKLTDVKKYKGIKKGKLNNINTITIPDFGRIKWVKEEDLPSLLIDGKHEFIVKTRYIDSLTELKTEASFACLVNAFTDKYNQRITEQECIDKAYERVNNFNTTSEDEIKTNDINIYNRFNELAEIHGYEERVYWVDVLINGNFKRLAYIFNSKGEILDDADWLIWNYEKYMNYLDEEMKTGELWLDGEPYIKLNESNTYFQLPCKDYIINRLYMCFNRYEVSQSCNDWIDVTLPNDRTLLYDIELLVGMLKCNIRIVEFA